MLLLSALLLALAQPGDTPGEAPPDPHCPRGDLNHGRPADLGCIGRLTPRYSFAVTYPREIAAIPPLLRRIRMQAAADQALLRRQADAEWARARREGEGEPPHFFQDEAWDLDAALPELAAISATTQIYTGGAHEGLAYDSYLLDRRTGRPVTLAAIFSGRGGMGAVGRGLCAALTAEFRERRGDPAATPPCPPAAGVPVTLICTNGRIGSLRALLGPYVVGSWAEGPYEIDFDVTPRMRAAVAPRFRAAFLPRPGAGRCGGG